MCFAEPEACSRASGRATLLALDSALSTSFRGDFSLDQNWPSVIWTVRHGESAGNVARDAADAAGMPTVDIDVRDVDVPLSPLGERQSQALGRWFAAMPAHERPSIVLTSPYLRARQT